MTSRRRQPPRWHRTPARPPSYRSIFKWGAPDRFKHPNDRLVRMLEDRLALPEAYFDEPMNTGDEPVRLDPPSRMEPVDVRALGDMVGQENATVAPYARLKYATGKTAEEALALRQGADDEIPVADLVLHPRDRKDVAAVVAYCHDHRIPVTVYGGGSSVTGGLCSPQGGVTLVLQTHMNRVIAFNETNQTITVEPGMLGPVYEQTLNEAPRRLKARRRYTGGHFPQSFEFSSVGGWVVTQGSGQASSYYGDARDLVMAQEWITPAGTIRTADYPATATGPRVHDMMLGSEGTFGVLVEVTMKIFRFAPENRRRFAFLFPSWPAAAAAARDISQGEFGMPSVLRISDAEETEVVFALYGIDHPLAERVLALRGYPPGKRCLMIGAADGQRRFAGHVAAGVKRICRRHRGMYLTGYPVRRWEHGRFTDPYLREDLNDHGIMIDTLETGVTWDGLARVHRGIRDYVTRRPHTVCMTHCSHFYPQGTNLYVIFIGRFDDLASFRTFHRGVVSRIIECGGSLSHHHGVGRLLAPWMQQHLGPEQMAVLQALKRHFDPRGIMNPGGTLGLNGP